MTGAAVPSDNAVDSGLIQGSTVPSMATSLSRSHTGVQDLIGTPRYRNDMDPGSRTRDMRWTGSGGSVSRS